MMSLFYDFDSPFRAFDRLAREMDRYSAPEAAQRAGSPAFDLYESEDALVFRSELPGVKPEDLNVTIEDGVLQISAKRDLATPEGYELRTRERAAFSFDKKWKLGTRVAADNAEAKLENGILTLTLPKAPEEKPKKITITAS